MNDKDIEKTSTISGLDSEEAASTELQLDEEQLEVVAGGRQTECTGYVRCDKGYKGQKVTL